MSIKGQFGGVALKGNIETSLVVNGNFTTTNNWTGISVSGFSVANNIASFTAIETQGRIRQTREFVNGRSYFVRALVKADSNQAQLGIDGGSVSHTGSNTFENLYAKVIWTAATGTYGFIVRDLRASGWTQIQVKEFFAIDMGANSSNPLYSLTAAQMNARFSNWFDGTKSTISLSKTLRTVNF